MHSSSTSEVSIKLITTGHEGMSLFIIQTTTKKHPTSITQLDCRTTTIDFYNYRVPKYQQSSTKVHILSKKQ